MRRGDEQRLQDVQAAIDAIHDHLRHGDLSQGIVFDAIRIRLLEIGQAVKMISPTLLDLEPDVPWRLIAGMRDQLAHRYFDTSHAVVAGTVQSDLPTLLAAVQRLQQRVGTSPLEGDTR